MKVRLRRPFDWRKTAPSVLSPVLPAAPFDWREVFGDDRPVELEVGHGKGAFLVASAGARPDVNLVGVENSWSCHAYAAERVARRRLSNVRVVHADAKRFLREQVWPGTLAAIHLYCPDPWWKQRHQKRRLVTDEFAASCASRLQSGGRVYLATDVADRFGWMCGVFDAQPALARCAVDEVLSGFETNFERKARLAGRAVHRAAWSRREDVAADAPAPGAAAVLSKGDA